MSTEKDSNPDIESVLQGEVADDTEGSSDFFDNLAFDYVELYRDSNIDFENFHINDAQKNNIISQIENWMILELREDVNESRIKHEIENNKPQIINRISALIIRQKFGWGEMQMFLNENDEVISTSLSLLKNKI